MLADSEAMSVDAITYLFNLCAERIQNRPFTETELSLTPEERDYRRELQRLYLEMIPPSISVLVLIAITCYAFMDAFETLYEIDSSSDNDDDVSVPIMFVFSGVNLLLDVVNVTCFARADMNFSLDILRQERSLIRESMRGLHIDSPDMDAENENTKFLSPTANHQTYDGVVIDTEAASFAPTSLMVNLNMCSAWTHVCADTLRSSAVLVAAAIATVIPSVDGDTADSSAAIIVSAIILVSLVPLVQGIVLTGISIVELKSNRPSPPRIDE